MNKFIEENKQVIYQLAEKYNTIADIHKADHIFRFIVTHPSFSSVENAIEYYFSDGEKSAHILTNLIKELVHSETETIKLLEFASGYGCVTRHLIKEEMKLDITSCDIHQEAVNFIEEKLGVNGLLSCTQPENLNLDLNLYDVIFGLSFFSHMPDTTWFRWLSSLYNAVIPGGLLIFTTHGYQSMKACESPEAKLNAKGYCFLAGSEQLDLNAQDYGVMIVSPAYVCEKIKLLPGNPIIARNIEGFWWGHQDLWIVKKEV